MTKRRETRTVKVGNVLIGSNHPVTIQSMTKTDTSNAKATAEQARALEAAGCEIVRVAVRNSDDAAAIAAIKKDLAIPVVADIHFDYRLAIEAVCAGADKIRINPGNIAKTEDIDRVIGAAAEKSIPIRIGVNSGSLMDVASGKGDNASRMVDAVKRYLGNFSKKDFNDIVLSLKSSSVSETVAAYRAIAAECDYPLHVGVTAAGLPEEGIVRSSVGIGALLLDGIGDTIRVSLTGDPVLEVGAARRILAATGARVFGSQIIACPTCGRCGVDLVSVARELEERIVRDTDKPLIVAVMGCEVNGPGEAKHADIGIAFGKGKGALFRRGEIVKTVAESAAVDELLKMIEAETKG